MGNAECVMKDKTYDGTPLTCCMQRDGWGDRPPAGFRLPPKINPLLKGGENNQLGPMFAKLVDENREDEANRAPGLPQQRRIELQKKRLELLRAQLEVERSVEQKTCQQSEADLSSLSHVSTSPLSPLSPCHPLKQHLESKYKYNTKPTDPVKYKNHISNYKYDSMENQNTNDVQQQQQQHGIYRPVRAAHPHRQIHSPIYEATPGHEGTLSTCPPSNEETPISCSSALENMRKELAEGNKTPFLRKMESITSEYVLARRRDDRQLTPGRALPPPKAGSIGTSGFDFF